MDSKKISRIFTIVAAVIGVIATIFLVRIILAGDDAIENDPEVQNSIISPFITFTQIVLYATAGLALVFSILNLVKNPAALKKSLLGLGVLGVLLAIAYFTASGDVVKDFAGDILEESKNPAVSKWVSALINFTGLLGLAGVVVIALGIVRSATSR